MDRIDDTTAIETLPLAGVHDVYVAMARASEMPKNADGSTTVELPDEFAPRAANVDLLTNQGHLVTRAASELFERLETLIGTVYGTEVGEFVRTKSIQPNPELSARLRDTRDRVHQALAASLFAGRLLAYYESLASFLQTAAWPVPTDLLQSLGPLVPRPGCYVDVTSPESAQLMGLRPFTEIFKDAEKGICRGMARGPNKDGHIEFRLPEALRPRTYVEGMPLIWELARQAIHDAKRVAVPLAELCRLTVGMELAELIRTRNPQANVELQSAIRMAGLVITTVLEHIWNGAVPIGTAPMLVDVMKSSK